MNPISEELKQKYRKIKSSVLATLKKVKAHPPRNLDQWFEEQHEDIFEKTDCLTCGNCCRTTSPMLFEKDIERLSSALRMREKDFVQSYLFLDTDGIYAMKSTPCPFLGDDNACSVYDDRPKACREFPHTNHRKMHTHLHLIPKNVLICPAVYEIAERIKSLN